MSQISPAPWYGRFLVTRSAETGLCPDVKRGVSVQGHLDYGTPYTGLAAQTFHLPVPAGPLPLPGNWVDVVCKEEGGALKILGEVERDEHMLRATGLGMRVKCYDSVGAPLEYLTSVNLRTMIGREIVNTDGRVVGPTPVEHDVEVGRCCWDEGMSDDEIDALVLARPILVKVQRP